MNKKYIKTFALVAFAIIIPIMILLIMVISEQTSYKEIKLANVMDDSATVVIAKSSDIGRTFTSSVLRINGEKINACHEIDQVEPCVSTQKDLKGYSYYDIRNLKPDSQYSFAWTDTLLGNLINSPNGEGVLNTSPTSEGVPFIGRIYGKVLNNSGEAVNGALVYVVNDESSGFQPFAAVSGENGTYNITYTAGAKKNFLQDFTVVSEEGTEVTYKTASFYNQPVADISVDQDNLESSLFVSKVEARTSCSSTPLSGIRAQCNDKNPWVDTLDTSTCPSNEHFFRLGVIEHTDDTHLLKPSVITLKLLDTSTNEFLKDPETEEEMVFRNGDYIDTDIVTTLEFGKTYAIKAYGSSDECVELDAQPKLIYQKPAGPPSDGDGNPPQNGNNTIPPLEGETQLCKKAGENFGVGFEVAVSDMKQAVDTGMRWGEALITDLGGVSSYKKSVINGRNVGMNMILRLCFKGTCKVDSGREYGAEIVKVYNELLESGQLPQQGLFIHAGHNEPNNAEYRPPEEEAQFIADVLKALDNEGILSDDLDDIGVKAIGPNMDLITGGGGWGGCNESDPNCDDPEPHDTYSADVYIGKMMEHEGFEKRAKAMFAWAGNTYLVNGTDNTEIDISGFASTLESKGLSDKIFVTELGRFDKEMSFDDLKSAYDKLDQMDNVVGILLFNSIGANPDPNFDYHEKLWGEDGLSLRKSIVSDCEQGTFGVPQEGSTGGQYDGSQDAGGSGGGPYNSEGVPVGGVGGGGDGAYGGSDRCAKNDAGYEVCDNTKDDPGKAVDAGIVNGDADTHKNTSSGEVPVYWHPWHADGTPAPNYEAAEGTQTEKPEYQDEVANKMVTDGEKTMDAGAFQHVFRDTSGATVSYLFVGSAKAEVKHSVKTGPNTPDHFSKDDVKVKKNCTARLGIDDTPYADGEIPSYTKAKWSGEVKLGDEWQYVEVKQDTSTGHVSLFSRITCLEPEISGLDTDVSVSWHYEASWDALGLYTLFNRDGTISEQFQLGDVSNVSEDYEFCSAKSRGGPKGTPCWDKVMDISAALPQGGSSDNVLGSASITLPEKGKYQVTSEFFTFENPYIYNFTDDKKELPMWQDRDGDGEFDEDEYLVPSVMDTQVTRVGDVIEFDLKPGITLLSVPFYTDDFDEALEILNQVRTQGGSATAVASFSNTGAKPGWKSTSQRGEQVYGEDYKLEVGDAVYLVVQQPMKLRLEGADYTQPVQQYVKEGWNLIAMKGGSQTMHASELIASLNDLPGVTVTKVTIWDPGRGRYISYVVTDGAVYGDDFLVDETMGIFVLVENGIGYWTPT